MQQSTEQQKKADISSQPGVVYSSSPYSGCVAGTRGLAKGFYFPSPQPMLTRSKNLFFLENTVVLPLPYRWFCFPAMSHDPHSFFWCVPPSRPFFPNRTFSLFSLHDRPTTTSVLYVSPKLTPEHENFHGFYKKEKRKPAAASSRVSIFPRRKSSLQDAPRASFLASFFLASFTSSVFRTAKLPTR